jgi:hypothetical protein
VAGGTMEVVRGVSGTTTEGAVVATVGGQKVDVSVTSEEGAGVLPGQLSTSGGQEVI